MRSPRANKGMEHARIAADRAQSRSGTVPGRFRRPSPDYLGTLKPLGHALARVDCVSKDSGAQWHLLDITAAALVLAATWTFCLAPRFIRLACYVPRRASRFWQTQIRKVGVR